LLILIGAAVALLIAIFVAALSAVVAIPFAYYRFWFSWRKRLASLLVAVYLLVEGVGGGGLAWFFADIANAKPFGSPVWQGLTLGATGALIFRSDLASRPKPSKGKVDDHAAAQVKSVLVAMASWLTVALDDTAQGAVERWFRELVSGTNEHDEALLRHGEGVKSMIDLDESTPLKTRKQSAAFVQRHLDSLRESQGNLAEARAHVSTYCSKYYANNRLSKP
jgi:hypothetical protein